MRRGFLSGLAAAIVLTSSPIAAAAQNQRPTSSTPGDGDLRIDTDFDPSAAEEKPLKRPYSAGDDQTPTAPFSRGKAEKAPAVDSRSEENAPADEASAPPPARKPKIDLFDEPSTARIQPMNAAVPPAAPKGALRSPSPAMEMPGVERSRLRRDETDAGVRKAASTVRTDTEADDKQPPTAMSGTVGGRLSLPSVPVRSSRTEALNGRLNLRSAPLRGTFPPVVDEPFAPIGLRLGSFVLYAALEQSAGYSSNLDEAPNSADGAFSDSTVSARLQSDWSRHAAEIDMLANYRRDFGGETPSDPDVVIDGRLRLDVDRLTTANLRGGFVYRKEDATDLDSIENIDGERPNLLNYSASADLQHEFGEAFARGTVSATRETQDWKKGIGAPDENFNTYTGALRAGYRLSPAVAPFVEGSAGRRIFDEGADALGRTRDSTIASLRGGVAFDLGEKLAGEVAAGYAWNDPDADAVDTMASPTFDAKIAWSPQRGTDLALTASTTFDPDTVDLTTSTLYQAGVAARHRATARLDLNAALIGGYRDGELRSETERTWGASAGFTYWINRSLALIGLASHDDVDRLHSAGDYDVETVKLGIRLQN